MKKRLFIKFVILMTSIGNADAQALGRLKLKKHKILSDGCPEGSVSVTLTDDQSALSVLFDNFNIQKETITPLTVKRCNLSIPFDQDPGQATVIEQLDVRGYNNLPHQSSSHLMVRYALGGKWIPVMRKDFKGPIDLDFYESVPLGRINGRLKTQCGESFNLDLSLVIAMVTKLPRESALMAVDSLDGRSGQVTYRLSRETCRPGRSITRTLMR